MNAKAWFYGMSFHGNIDRSGYATQSEIAEPQTCPLCNGKIDMLVHTVARIYGKIAHDYCIRTKVGK